MYDENLEYYFSLEKERIQSKSMEKNIQQSISVLYRLNVLVNKTYVQERAGEKETPTIADDVDAMFNKWQKFY